SDILIIPRRVVPRLSDLKAEEVSDLFLSVQKVGQAIERAYNAEALTISLQDGTVAGQSVPHVHVHIMPRHRTDFGGDNDKIYPAIESAEGHLNDDFNARESPGLRIPSSEKPNGNSGLKIPSGEERNGNRGLKIPLDEERFPRTTEEMEREASWLAGFF
ncbi:HIT-like domain-containing protein, partial [Naematelia encephala]